MNIPNWMRQSDLVAGIAAAVAFLVMVLLVGLPWWLGAVASVGAYFGLRLVMPEHKEGDDMLAEAKLKELQGLADQLGYGTQSEMIRGKLKSLCSAGDTLLAALRNRPENTSYEAKLLGLYLNLILEPVRQFVALPLRDARQDLSEEPARQLATVLDGAAGKLRGLMNNVLADNYAEIKVSLEALNETFKYMDSGSTQQPTTEQPPVQTTSTGEGEQKQ